MPNSISSTKPQLLHGGTTWTDVAWLMLSDVIGTSVLVFPGIAQKLGWLLTVVFICGLFPISLFVSVLMARTRSLLTDLAAAESSKGEPPNLGTMGEVARQALGPGWAAVVYFSVYGYNLLGQASYLLVLGTSIQQVFWSTPMCITGSIAAACALLLTPIFTIRKLGESVRLCLINTILIVAVITVALVHVAGQGRASCSSTHFVPPGLTPMVVLGQVTNVLYAFTGQWMYFELMDTMAQPKDFPRAFAITGPFMMSAYLIVALVAYALGAGHDDLMSSMGAGLTLRFVAALLFVHVAIVYLIKSVVLARYFHGLVKPLEVDLRTGNSYLMHGSFGTGMLVFGYIVANAVPFFSQLLGLIGGLLAGPINFLIPIALYLAALGQHTLKNRVSLEAATENSPGATEYGTCNIDNSEHGAAAIDGEAGEQDSFTTESTSTSSQDRSASATFCAAICSLQWWEVAMLSITMVLTFLTIVLGFSEQVRQVLAMQSEFGAPFSCHMLVLPSADPLAGAACPPR